MKRGGLLDRFPLFLFANEGGRAPTLLVDCDHIGRLTLSAPSQASASITVVSPKRDRLEESRSCMEDFDVDRLSFIQAHPNNLPFVTNAFGNLVTSTSRKHRSNMPVDADADKTPVPDDLNRVLSIDGSLIEIGPVSTGVASLASTKGSLHQLKRRNYFIRPGSSDHYFVTREWAQRRWPFHFLHHGRLRSVRIALARLIGLLKIRPLYDGVQLSVHAASGNRALVEKLLDEVTSPGRGARTEPHQFACFIKTDWTAILVVDREDKLLVKCPLSPENISHMRRHLANIDALEAGGNAAVRSVLPQIIDRGEKCGQAYWSEAMVEGVPATKFWWKPLWQRKATESGFRFLISLHQSTRQNTRISQELFNELIGVQIKAIETSVQTLKPTFSMDQFAEALWQRLGGRQMPLVRTHGDFWFGNMIVSESADLKAVLDWDSSREDGWPLLDLLHLITFRHKWRATWYFGALVTRRLLKSRMSSWEKTLVAEYCAALGISGELWPALVAVYWLNRLAQAIDLFGEAWVGRNVIGPLPDIVDALIGRAQPAAVGLYCRS